LVLDGYFVWDERLLWVESESWKIRSDQRLVTEVGRNCECRAVLTASGRLAKALFPHSSARYEAAQPSRAMMV
jgi:hypothetical protein